MKFFFSLFRKKIFIYGAVIIVGIGTAGFVLFKNQGLKVETLVVHSGDFMQQVSVSGKVVATESLDLSFEQGGRVANVGVQVGDKVVAGQLLASQDIAQLDAQLAEMHAGIDVQKAKLDQLRAGASPEDITISETAVANTEVAVANAKQAIDNTKQDFTNTLQDAYTKSDDAVRGKADQLFSNPRSTSPKLNPLFIEDRTSIERERLLIESILRAWAESLNGASVGGDIGSAEISTEKNLEQVKSFLDTLAFGVNALTLNSDTSQTTLDKWKTDISTARANINTAISSLSAAKGDLTTREANLKTAQGNLKTAQDQLTLKKTPARSPDIALYEAQIRQAEAGAANVMAQLGKKQIRSPINGVVTVVNSKIGSNTASNEVVISLISTDTLQIESYVPEKNIPLISIGDESMVTLDAYGDAAFAAKVISIDPAETIRDGVSTYRTKLQFLDRDARIKSGMTASVLITTEKKSHTIAVPQGIVATKDGNKFVKVKEGDAIIDRNIKTGSVSSLGQIEIISGLKDGDVVILESIK